jgi:pimeloyl-ACP methyl ester carboxylesterase
MADWDIRDEIHLIDVPTLIINGANDWVQDFVIEPFFSLIRKPVKWVRFERSSHTPFWEERDRYNEVVRTFVSIDV